MKLNELKDNDGARKSRMRVGRGIGSGKGKTCGRGHKGQGSRTGVSNMGEGGQTPLYMRVPKRGFNNINRKDVEVVNIRILEAYVAAKKLDAGKITKEALRAAGILKSKTAIVKILGTGDVKSKLVIEADTASKTVLAAVEKAGGKITLAEVKPKRTKVVKKEAA